MMPFNRILIATDGSNGAKAAVTKGLELAKSLDAEVTAMSIVEVPIVFGGRGMIVAAATNIPILEEVSKKAVEEARVEGEKLGITVKTVVRAGIPANEIVNASSDFDLIVLGSLGHSEITHFVMGSVAEKVVRHAACPVLVVRATKERPD